MRKIIIFILIITLIVRAYSQKIITSDFGPPTNEIKGNIMLIGVEHRKVDNFLISDSSKKMLGQIYPELVKASKGKHIVFLLEGLKKGANGYVDIEMSEKLGLPYCLESPDYYMGSETRPDSIVFEVLKSFLILRDYAYTDAMDGTEQNLMECFQKIALLNINVLDSATRNYSYRWGNIMGQENKKFENTLLSKARNLERVGFYVVIICGATHAIKLAVEQSQDNAIGYIILIKDPSTLWLEVKSAKLLSILEAL